MRKLYELNTVRNGTKPAPFMATRTFQQLAVDEETLIFRSQQEQYVKWSCNIPAVLDTLPTENLVIQDTSGVDLDPDQSVKTEGLTWMPITDTLRYQFEISPLKTDVPLTKRKILSLIVSLFDPLVLIGATTVSANIFMQQLWTKHVN